MKLNIKKPDMKKVKEVLQLAKKHLVSVICGVLAIAAIVACFWPTGNLYNGPGGLVEEVNNSIATIQKINNLEQQPRMLPQVSLDDTPQPLGFPPNANTVEQGKQRVGDLMADSKAMLQDAVGLNTHNILGTQSLDQEAPTRRAFYSIPDAQGVRQEGTGEARTLFAQMYIEATTNDQRIRTWPAADAQLRRPKGDEIPPLMPGIAPSPDDITAALNDRQNQINAHVLQTNQQTGQVTQDSKDLAAREYAEQSRSLPLQMSVAVAQKCKVYLQPGALAKSAAVANFTGVTAPSSTDVWDAQRYLWVQEDVATGVAYANASAHNVMDAPIKRIVDLELPAPYVFTGNGDLSQLKDDGQVPLQKDQSVTGHVSNGMYDVIHFTLEIDVDAGMVPQAIESLERGQFISVLNVHFKSVDGAQMIDNNFIYGPSPVVRLNLDCEELMLRQWVSNIEPAAPPVTTPPQ